MLILLFYGESPPMCVQQVEITRCWGTAMMSRLGSCRVNLFSGIDPPTQVFTGSIGKVMHHHGNWFYWSAWKTPQLCVQCHVASCLQCTWIFVIIFVTLVGVPTVMLRWLISWWAFSAQLLVQSTLLSTSQCLLFSCRLPCVLCWEAFSMGQNSFDSSNHNKTSHMLKII